MSETQSTTPVEIAVGTIVKILPNAFYTTGTTTESVIASRVGKVGKVERRHADGDLYVGDDLRSGNSIGYVHPSCVEVVPDSTAPLAVGDHVVVVDNQASELSKGMTGVITKVTTDWNDSTIPKFIDVEWTGEYATSEIAGLGWLVTRFVRQEEETAPVGAAEVADEPSVDPSAVVDYTVDIRQVYVLTVEANLDSRNQTKVAGVGDGNWIKTRGNEVLETGQGALPSDMWTLLRVMTAEQFQTFLLAVAGQAKTQREAARMDRQRLTEAQEWKQRLVEAAHEEADTRDYCDEFDDFMERNGLPRRSKTYDVEVEVTLSARVTVQVQATSEDDAIRLADGMESSVLHDQLANEHGVRDLSLDEWDAKEASREG